MSRHHTLTQSLKQWTSLRVGLPNKMFRGAHSVRLARVSMPLSFVERPAEAALAKKPPPSK